MSNISSKTKGFVFNKSADLLRDVSMSKVIKQDAKLDAKSNGRPKKPSSEKLSEQITIKFTKVELVKLKNEFSKSGMTSFASFLRVRVLNI